MYKKIISFNFVNRRSKIHQILQPQMYANQELFMITDSSSLLFSTFRTQDYMMTHEYFRTNALHKNCLEGEGSNSSRKESSKKSTNPSENNVKMFCFKNSSRKIKKILLGLTDNYRNQNRNSLVENHGVVQDLPRICDSADRSINLSVGKCKNRIKKMNFRNSSDIVAKFKKSVQ